MGEFFNAILYQPIFNALVLLYDFLPGRDFGLAIITLTVLIRLLFIPLSIKTLRSQRALARIQPRIKALQEKYKTDKTALGQATMALYKEEQVNPFGGCLPLLIQLPILIGLYQAFSRGLKPESLSALYSFVPNPGTLKTLSLGFLDLAAKSPWLAVTAGVLQWWQARQAAKYQRLAGADPSDAMGRAMSRQMLYFFPVMIIIIAWNLPTGLTLYWLVTTLFSIGEQFFINRRISH